MGGLKEPGCSGLGPNTLPATELALSPFEIPFTPVRGRGGDVGRGRRNVDLGESLGKLSIFSRLRGCGFTVTFLQGFCPHWWFMGSLGLRTSEELDPACPQLPKVGLAGPGGSRSRSVHRGPD